MGVTCFYATRTHLPKLRFHSLKVKTYTLVEVNLMDYTRSDAIESVLSFPVLNLANDWRFLGFYFKTRCSKNSIRTCRLVNKVKYPKVWVISHVCDSYRADNCSFWWNQPYKLCSLFLLFNIVKKIAILLIFFYYKVSAWKLPINVEGGRKHLLPRSRCGRK